MKLFSTGCDANDAMLMVRLNALPSALIDFLWVIHVVFF